MLRTPYILCAAFSDLPKILLFHSFLVKNGMMHYQSVFYANRISVYGRILLFYTKQGSGSVSQTRFPVFIERTIIQSIICKQSITNIVLIYKVQLISLSVYSEPLLLLRTL